MKEAPKRRIKLTSSLIEMISDQLGNRVVVRAGERRFSARPHPFLQHAFGQTFNEDMNGFSLPRLLKYNRMNRIEYNRIVRHVTGMVRIT